MTKYNSASVFQKHFPNFSDRQIQQLGHAGELYKYWNERVNVISRKDIDHIYDRHLLHGLAIAKLIEFEKDTRILDIGTGGGFPGIPLAIAFPNTHFHLIDSIGKKIGVVKTITEELKLDNVTSEQKRAERIKDKYDFVTCRAVARLSKLIPWIRHNISLDKKHEINNGLIALKGGDLIEELAEIQQPIKTFEISSFFEDPFFETKKIIHVAL